MSPDVPCLVDDWEQHWDAAAGLLAPSCKASHMTLDEVQAALAMHRADLWLAPDAAVVTLDDGPDLVYWVAGGNIATLQAHTPRLERWAKERGHTRLVLLGRPGWARSYLRQRGYEVRVLMTKELQDRC